MMMTRFNGNKPIKEVIFYSDKEITPKGLVSLYNQGYIIEFEKFKDNPHEQIIKAWR